MWFWPVNEMTELCFWHASTSIRGRIFVSARITAGFRFKRFLCFGLIDVRWFRILPKTGSRTCWVTRIPGWRLLFYDIRRSVLPKTAVLKMEAANPSCDFVSRLSHYTATCPRWQRLSLESELPHMVRVLEIGSWCVYAVLGGEQREVHNEELTNFFRRADNSRPVSLTVSSWGWVNATNLSRLQREREKQANGTWEKHTVY
jgi:hypothetical protein